MRSLLCNVFALLAVAGIGAGCTPDYKPPPKEKDKAPAKENVVKVETAVPYGKVVACDDVFKPDDIGAFLGDIVEIRDRTKSSLEATSVCAIIKAGEPPKSPTEVKEEQKNQILGVLPGDEYCTITLYCSRPADFERFKKRCEEKGDEGNRDLDQYSCVHKSQRAAKFAYTYKTIHASTKCEIDVMGGPSVTDEPVVQNCTKAAISALRSDNLKNYKARD